MHLFVNLKHNFCCYQNIFTYIMYLKILNEEIKKLIYFFLFLGSCFLPSIKKTNFDKIKPTTGTQNFS